MERTALIYLTKHIPADAFTNVRGSAVSAQLFSPPKILTGAPLMVVYKKVMLCYISRLNVLQNKIS